MAGLTWDHTEDIAISLYEAHPQTDPTHIRFTDLHKWVTELPNFKDDPAASTEGKWKRFKCLARRISGQSIAPTVLS